MTPAEKRTAEITARLEAASDGPWHVGGIAYNNVILARQDEPDASVGYEGMWPVYPIYGPKDDKEPQPQESANLDFIANAPADIDHLLAELKKAQDMVVRAGRLLELTELDAPEDVADQTRILDMAAEIEAAATPHQEPSHEG